MEKIFFSEILTESWHRSFSRVGFFVFGFFIALPATLYSILFSSTENFRIEEWLPYISSHQTTILTFLFIYFLSTLFGKSNLILSLHHNIKQTDTKKEPLFKTLFLSIKKAFFIDLVMICFFFLFISTLSLPALISYATFGTVKGGLIALGMLVFFPVTIIAFFVREFTFFYFLLTPLKLKSSFEAGVQFFLRFRTFCLWFGFFSLLTDLLFTFSYNLVMLPIVAFFTKTIPSLSETTLFLFGSLIAVTWYTVFKQSLWLSFFHRLASPKDAVMKEEKVSDPLLEKEASEIPSA